MGYWWANQNENYPLAIVAGTLWAMPDSEGRWSPGRKPIFDLRVGDIVIHHAHGVVRAVSRVSSEARSHPRPAENPPVAGETFEFDADGQLVKVDVIRDDLDLPQVEYARLVPHQKGAPSPLATDGRPKRLFLQPLGPVVARRLLAARDVVVAERAPLPYELDVAGPTDATTVALLRREQTKLRRHLLGGKETGTCELCGREFPADLLVAAHIQRRSELSEEQRRQFDTAAMLACVLGCDALFEAGYIVVDADGLIAPARPASGTALRDAVDALVGRPCGRHDDGTAAYFAARLKQAIPS